MAAILSGGAELRLPCKVVSFESFHCPVHLIVLSHVISLPKSNSSFARLSRFWMDSSVSELRPRRRCSWNK